MTFTLGFQPAINKTGYSKMRFLGIETKSGVTNKLDKNKNKVIDEETGEEIMINWSITNLCFEVMGMVKGQWQKISITCSEKYSEDNLLGKTLNRMGFVPSTIDYSEDEEGFIVLELEVDEEGFSSVDNCVIDEIREFLVSCVNKEFIAKVYKSTEGRNRGFWQIEVETLTPYVKQNGKKG